MLVWHFYGSSNVHMDYTNIFLSWSLPAISFLGCWLYAKSLSQSESQRLKKEGAYAHF